MSRAVLWTGGKDCAMALHRTRASVTELVTFVPTDAHFLAHDLELMQWQARALGLPHCRELVEPPFEVGYERALQRLQARGIDTVITGDLAEVDGLPNFIAARAERVGMAVELPLWGAPREAHLRSLVDAGFEIVLTLVKEPWLDASWAGRVLDVAAIEELLLLQAANGLDPAGENGEYHSMVLSGPGFAQRLRLETRVRSEGAQHSLEVLRISS